MWGAFLEKHNVVVDATVESAFLPAQHVKKAHFAYRASDNDRICTSRN